MRERPEHEWHTAADMPRLDVVPVERLAPSRLDQLMALYAPADEDGIVHPGEGFITAEQLRRLMEIA